ncbi:MAG: hypothetical protein JNM07_10530 [Phycisphaerae bacterium]|nr:hypothetical protein [Phycisphaerae bacterium]
MRTVCLFAPLAVTLSIAGAATADSVNIASNSQASTEKLGAYSGSITYSALTASTGTLVFSLTNTTSPALGGFITGFVFDLNSAAANANVVLSAASHGTLTNAANQNAAPFGSYELGAAIGGSFLGGGNPTSGIAVGATGTFSFNVTASDAGALNAHSFLNASRTYPMVVRFRGFANGGSDKVPGQENAPENIPLPSAAAIGLAGLGVIASPRRRRA